MFLIEIQNQTLRQKRESSSLELASIVRAMAKVSRSVALIDDDSTQLQLMKAQLTSLGGNVTTFESGDAFLRHRRIGSVWDLVVVSAPRSRCLWTALWQIAGF